MKLSGSTYRSLRRLQTVPRWSIIPMLRRQSVGEHSFQTCVLALWLAERHASLHTEAAMGRLMLGAVLHEELEAISGDMPSPFKRGVGPSIKLWEESRGAGLHHPSMGFTPQELNLLKVADILEAMLFAHEDELMGNGTLNAVFKDLHKNLENVWPEFKWDEADRKPSAHELVATMLIQFAPNIHPGLE